MSSDVALVGGGGTEDDTLIGGANVDTLTGGGDTAGDSYEFNGGDIRIGVEVLLTQQQIDAAFGTWAVDDFLSFGASWSV